MRILSATRWLLLCGSIVPCRRRVLGVLPRGRVVVALLAVFRGSSAVLVVRVEQDGRLLVPIWEHSFRASSIGFAEAVADFAIARYLDFRRLNAVMRSFA